MTSRRQKEDGSQSQNGLNEDDVNKMVSDIVFYLLTADQKKSVIKKADLSSKCGLSNKSNAVRAEVIDKAKKKLLETFGIMVHEPQTGQYYLINQIQAEQEEGESFLTWSDKENAQMALTFTILGLIQFNSNEKITDEALFKFLKQMGVFCEDERGGRRPGRGREDEVGAPVPEEVAELFEGDVKKFVNDVLVNKQHYLKRDRIDSPDTEVEAYEYSWGERAKLELTKKDVFDMVCEVYECEPKMFKEQYDKAYDGEEAE